MKRGSHILSARKVATLSQPGRHADGGGLYLVVDPSGAKRWAFIYRWKDNPSVPGSGRLREMGLGGYDVVSLADARNAADEARRLKLNRIDPISSRRTDDGVPTFGVVAQEVIRVKTENMRSDKSVARIRRSLERDAKPLWSMRVDAVTTEDVLRVLKPMWETTSSSARATRGHLEAVFDAAKARGHRKVENPARWKGHLDQLLAARPKLARGHHAAMAYEAVPAFIQTLRSETKLVAAALEFLILTAARSGEVLGATWPEIDLEKALWIVPATRMKAGREHRVPLCARAVEILRAAEVTARDEFVFPGQKHGRPLSNMAFEMFLRRAKLDVTTHGFRSSFRDWVGEETNFPTDVAEMALAHVSGNATERAYRRGDALEKRRRLMEAWEQYVDGRTSANIIDFERLAGGR